MKDPLVTVIVPVYNTKEYLDQCINSILVQTYAELEVLIIDDGSTDGSGTICDSYAAGDKRIQVFNGPNRGLSAARNIGLQNCKGRWVTFIDSDDFVHPEMVESLLNAALENNAQVVIGEAVLTVKDAADYLFKDETGKPVAVRIVDSTTVLEKHLNNKMRKSIWGMLFDIELVRKAYFPENRLYEDIPYLPLVLRSRPKIAWIDKAIYAYRSNPDSITHQKINMKSSDRIIMKELQVRRIMRYFPELRALAVGGLYADCMVWWIKADEADDKRAGKNLKHSISKCIRRNPLTWDILTGDRLTIGRRLSLFAAKTDFFLCCRIKKQIVHLINR